MSARGETKQLEEVLDPHPSTVTVFVHLHGFIQVLGIQTHNCKRKHDLQKSHDNVDDIWHAETRASTIPQTHDESTKVSIESFCCFIVGKSLILGNFARDPATII